MAFTPPHTKPAGMSSSPSLPSPSQLFSSMPLRPPGGSRATPIPADALPGISSASSLLRQVRSSGEDASQSSVKRLGLEEGCGLRNGNKLPGEGTKAKGEKKVATFRKPGVSSEEDPEPIKRDIVAVKSKGSAILAKDSDTLPPKKSRKKKSKDEGETQTKIKKTKITKPGAARSTDKPKKAASTTKKPKQSIATLAELPVGTQVEDAQAREEFRELCLENAIPLRREWTPVRDTVQALNHSDDVERSTASAPCSDARRAKVLPVACFGKLLGDFGFAQKDDGSAPAFEVTRKVDGEAMVKRRKIELVDGVCPPPAKNSQRTKSPKKKPQTVTGKATAPFVPFESLETPSVLQYFGASTIESEPNTNGQINQTETPVTVRRRSPVKKTAKPRSTTAKAKKQKQPILFSPESAMKTARDQQVLFGTSSQLAREDSPTFLKDLQKAMKESEYVDDEWELSAVPSAKFKPYNSLALTRSRDLWSVASRDLSGALLNAEVVDLSVTPKPHKIVAHSIAVPMVPKIDEIQQKAKEDGRPGNEFADLQSIPTLNLDVTPALQQQIQEPEPEPEPVIPRSVAEAALRKRPKSRSPVKKAAGAKPALDKMPNYKGFTDLQLSKEVASYSFKSIKRREAKIVLLERCWESKVAMASEEVPVNAHVPQHTTHNAVDEQSKGSSPAKKKGRPSKAAAAKIPSAEEANKIAPKKPRGRPRKDSTATTSSPRRKRKVTSPKGSRAEAAALAGDEIYDSSPPTPSPPRRRSPPKSPGQLPLSSSLGASTISDTDSDKGARMRLFENMSRAITTFPPTSDPRTLTFHEKILMYEPVVLEDLTVWLNTEGLGRVGEDEEVSPGLVKAWCEEKSVCCLWRENLRGGTRSRW